ncbi:hypothetical protein BDN72DRAFT_682324 [Pluteus cervinus]|uniref:Uncharacterized protein n=1 Tax=Pluteus cervinus TaxID=181527 RepID=A0ACD3ARY9_9AGAR|nr:hypothetical protein BDN72DRAFT_682324 [Pluteus cervinus]
MFKGMKSAIRTSRSSKKGLAGLPDELLAIIFNMVCYNLPYTVGQTLLGRVCRKWRKMLLKNPRMWNYILVKYDARFQQAIAHGAQAWARNAKGFPLDVEVCFMDTPTVPINPARDDFWRQLLEPIQSQVQKLKIVAMVHDINGLRRPLRAGFPALEYLDISLYETPGQALSQKLFFPGGESFYSCPRLSKVRIDTGFYVQMLSEPKASSLVPWQQLSHLELDEQKGFQVEMLDVLSKCSRLTSCVLTMRGIDYNSSNYSKMASYAFTIPNLQSLTLYLRKLISPGPILKTLILPNLRSLTVAPAGDERVIQVGPCIVDALEDMERHAFFKLRKLSLSCLHLSTSRLIPFFMNQPKISVLHLNNCPVNTENLLSKLMPSHQGIILPGLVEFEFDTPHRTTAPDYNIVGFLKSRSRSYSNLARLRSAIYWDNRRMDITAITEIKELRKTGMDVQVPGLVYDTQFSISGLQGPNAVILGPRRHDDSVFYNIFGVDPKVGQDVHANVYFSRPGGAQLEQQMMDLCIRR